MCEITHVRRRRHRRSKGYRDSRVVLNLLKIALTPAFCAVALELCGSRGAGNQEFFGSGGDSAMSRRTLLVATTEYPPFRGGIGTYAREMARAAAMLGWSPVVWAPNYGSNQIESTAGGVHIERYEGGVPARSSLPRLMTQFSMTCGRHRPHPVLLCSCA